ncbi:dTMP kinase [Mesobacillus jeotgali]|uniref:dTMP kinase n=1 Tax=Mesobacillus jeotgali TaxID=129985 RepID=UPI000C860837|nr:dTMP kinase [Mesobacillus jeotgali]
MKNLFIVFEGIDGSGTSTQANLLRDYFINKDKKAVLTLEPSSGPIGNLIREGLKERVAFCTDSARFDQQMAYLFAADRHDHLYNDIDGVFKLLKEGKNVISTRYFFSSLAYHCSNEEEFHFVKGLNERFPNPDLVIYIDNPVETSLQRLQLRTVQDVYENKEKLVMVKKNYEKIFSEYDGTICIVRGDNNPDDIHKEIVKFIEEKLN